MFDHHVANQLHRWDPAYRREVAAKALLGQAKDEGKMTILRNTNIIKPLTNGEVMYNSRWEE